MGSELWSEANNSPPTSAEVKKAWIYISTPHTSSFVKRKDNSAFYILPSVKYVSVTDVTSNLLRINIFHLLIYKFPLIPYISL
jgi:hypothetical protein